MYLKKVFINGEAKYPAREISSRYCTILLGRAVINGYETSKVSDTVFEVTTTTFRNGDKLKHRYEYQGWDANTEAVLEAQEAQDNCY